MFHLFLSAMILAFTCGLPLVPLESTPKKNEYPKGEKLEYNGKDFGDMSKVSGSDYVQQVEDGLPCYTDKCTRQAGLPTKDGVYRRWSLGKAECGAQIKYCDWDDDNKRCHLNAKYGDPAEYKMMPDGFGCGSTGEWLEITDGPTCRAAMLKLCIFNDTSDIMVTPGKPIKYPRGCYEKYTSTNSKKQYYFNPEGNVYEEGEYPQYEKYATERLSICIKNADLVDEEDDECCWAETTEGTDLKAGEWDKGCDFCSIEECSTHADEAGVAYFAYTPKVYGGYCKVLKDGYNPDLSTHQGYDYKLYKCEADNC